MTLAYSLKNGLTTDQNLGSCVLGQNFDKTSGGYFGDLKPFFGATKCMDGCPLIGAQGFWRQKQIWRTSFYEYQIPAQSRIAIASKNGEVTKLRVLYALLEVLLRLLLYDRVNKKNREKKYIYSVEASIKDWDIFLIISEYLDGYLAW